MDLWSAKWIVIDTETTGIDLETSEVCEIGARYFQHGEVLPPRLGMLINPKRPIPLEASEVHGITDSMVADCPTLLEVADRIFERLANADVIVAYNGLGYDFPLLERIFADEAKAFGCQNRWLAAIAGKPLIDPFVLIKHEAVGKYWRGKGTRKLSAVCERFGITVSGQAHRAGADCEMAGKALWHLGQHYPEIARMGEDLTAMAAEVARLKIEQDEEFRAWQRRQTI